MKYKYNFVFLWMMCWGSSLFSQGHLTRISNYDSLIVEIERDVFDANNDTARFKTLLYKAQVQKAHHHYEASLVTLHRLDYLPEIRRLSSLHRYEQALVSYLSADFDLAARYYENLTERKPSQSFLDSTYWLHCLIQNQLGHWEQGKAVLKRYSEAMALSIDADSLYELIDTNKMRSPATASLLSVILPGLGQTYAGYPLQGLMSLILTAGATAYSVLHFRDGYYLIGGLSSISLFLRFYGGGIRSAAFFAEQKNQKLQQTWCDLIIKSIDKEVQESR